MPEENLEVEGAEGAANGAENGTDEKELTVMPIGFPPSAQLVMTATPVVNQPSALRNLRDSSTATLPADPSTVLIASSLRPNPSITR